jgi:hypothetical protein
MEASLGHNNTSCRRRLQHRDKPLSTSPQHDRAERIVRVHVAHERYGQLDDGLEQCQPDWKREADQADGIAPEPKPGAFPLKVETL